MCDVVVVSEVVMCEVDDVCDNDDVVACDDVVCNVVVSKVVCEDADVVV